MLPFSVNGLGAQINKLAYQGHLPLAPRMSFNLPIR